MAGTKELERYARQIVTRFGRWPVHQQEVCPSECLESGCRRARAIALLFRLRYDGKPLSMRGLQIGVLDALSLDPAVFDLGHPSGEPYTLAAV